MKQKPRSPRRVTFVPVSDCMRAAGLSDKFEPWTDEMRAEVRRRYPLLFAHEGKAEAHAVRSLRDIIRPRDDEAAWYRNALTCAAPGWFRAHYPHDDASRLSDASLHAAMSDYLFPARAPDAFLRCPGWAREMLADVRRVLRVRR